MLNMDFFSVFLVLSSLGWCCCIENLVATPLIQSLYSHTGYGTTKYPAGNYSKDWYITTHWINHTIKINIKTCNIESPKEICTYDFLYVYDGSNNNATELLKTCCGKPFTDREWESSNGEMYLLFETDYADTETGFEIEYWSNGITTTTSTTPAPTTGKSTTTLQTSSSSAQVITTETSSAAPGESGLLSTQSGYSTNGVTTPITLANSESSAQTTYFTKTAESSLNPTSQSITSSEAQSEHALSRLSTALLHTFAYGSTTSTHEQLLSKGTDAASTTKVLSDSYNPSTVLSNDISTNALTSLSSDHIIDNATASSVPKSQDNSLYIIIACAVTGLLVLVVVVLIIVMCIKKNRPVVPQSFLIQTDKPVPVKNGKNKIALAGPPPTPPIGTMISNVETNLFDLELPEKPRGNTLPPLYSSTVVTNLSN